MTIPPQPSLNAMPPANPADLDRARQSREKLKGPRKREMPIQHRGILRMAERFINEHSHHLRYVHGIGWHFWDQARWKRDEKRTDIDFAVDTVKAALREAIDLGPRDGQDLEKDARKSENSGYEIMLKVAGARSPMSTAASELDSDSRLFNTPAGTIDLGDPEARDEKRRKWSVRPVNPTDMITKVSGGSYIPGLKSEEWERFLARILPDEEVRAFVQRLFGYAMLGKVTEHILPIFTGTGGNGKGTVRDAVRGAFGEYCEEVDPDIIMESGDRHGAFKMVLRGQRLVFTSETEQGKRLSEGVMKRLVGGDPIQANWMHSNPITFDPSHTLVMLTNFLPKVAGDDPAVWRRILVVPFDVTIPEEEKDPNLPGRLLAAKDAVLTWVFEGWLAYQQQGLNPPDAVRAKTRAYRDQNDALARFLEERTMPNPNCRVRSRDLYTAWSSWCRTMGEQAGSEVTFATAMERAGYEKKATNVGRQYLGVMLLDDDQADEDDPSGWPAGARRAAPQPDPVQTEISAPR
ncbi:phage/plasmid primase, P4 family [Kitasatospora sp. NPDC057198]|uniref:DNA primase family protein n=1 Tax=Kitasatospora sp. NPDC057198 TaxID=3346046 RepID=UPI00364513BC